MSSGLVRDPCQRCVYRIAAMSKEIRHGVRPVVRGHRTDLSRPEDAPGLSEPIVWSNGRGNLPSQDPS